MINKKFAIAILFFWGIILIGFLVYKGYTLRTGTELRLRTVPVDPRDLFRGDYVVLSYEISRIHLDSINYEESDLKRNDQIYLKLDTGSIYAQAIQLSRDPFEQGIFIKGKVKQVYERELNIEYGIETYFIRQGRGGEIERKAGKIDVIVAVDKRGVAIIKRLVYDGEDV